MSSNLLKKNFISVFGDFPEIDLFMKEVKIKKLPKNRVIYIPGDLAQSLFFIHKGLVSISRVTPNGRGVILDYIKVNQFFGEEILVENENGRWEIAETKQETHIAIIDRSLVKKYFFPNVDIVNKLLAESLAKRQRFAARMEILLHREVRVRLAALLLDLARGFGKKSKKGITIELNIPHHELARFIGATRETVSATISSFKTAGYIESAGRKIVLVQPNYLESLL
jgi:CRP-like cAMP-binding protein